MAHQQAPGEAGGEHSVVEIVDGAEFVTIASQRIADVLRAAVEARGGATVALAGGRTPEPVYRQLASIGAIDWAAVTIFFGDERAVPPDDPLSNYRMVNESLLAHLAAAPLAVHRMEAERSDVMTAAESYARLLPARLDLILLGIGSDGHTASLFPGSSAVTERRRQVVPVARSTPPDRMTITPPVLAAARQTLVLAAGSDKAVAVRTALLDDVSPLDCPSRLVRSGRWLLDRAAAAALHGHS